MAAVTKNRYFSNFIVAEFEVKMNSKFKCNYITMSSLTYIPVVRGLA